MNNVRKWRQLPANTEPILRFVDAVLSADCEARGRQHKCYVHIGAGGAQKHNPIYSLVRAAEKDKMAHTKWQVAAFEPIVDLCDEVEQDYAHADRVRVVCCAVANLQNGTENETTLHTLPRSVRKREALPEFFDYLSTAHQNNALFGVTLHNPTKDRVARLRETVQVRNVLLADALHEACVEHIDVLRINTQGIDWEILQQLDVTQQNLRPFCISSHVARLSPADREAMFSFLRRNGYKYRFHAGGNLIALDSHIIWQYWEDRSPGTPRSPCLDLCERTVARNSGAARVVRVTANNLRAFIEEGLPDAIVSLKKIAQRADYIRVRLVTAHGGAWLDTDTIVVRSMDTLWQRLDAEKIDLMAFNTSGIWDGRHLFNGFFIAPPHSDFMLRFFTRMEQVVERVRRDPSLPEKNWVLFGANIMSALSIEQTMYPHIALLSESGNVLWQIEMQFQDFIHKDVFDYLLTDKRVIVIPLFHTNDSMSHVSESNLQPSQSTLAKFLKLALQCADNP